MRLLVQMCLRPPKLTRLSSPNAMQHDDMKRTGRYSGKCRKIRDISLLGQFGLRLVCRYKISCNSKYIKSNDIKEGWSEPKTYWYRAEIPEFAVVTIFSHFRREI